MKLLLSAFRSYLKLTPQRRHEAWQLLLALARARWQVRGLPIQQLFEQLPRGYPLSQRLELREIRQLSRRLQRLAGLVPWRAKCLEQSLVMSQQLAAQGIPYQLCIGVKRGEQQAFAAHAWILVAGEVVHGGPVHTYALISQHSSHSSQIGSGF